MPSIATSWWRATFWWRTPGRPPRSRLSTPRHSLVSLIRPRDFRCTAITRWCCGRAAARNWRMHSSTTCCARRWRRRSCKLRVRRPRTVPRKRCFRKSCGAIRRCFQRPRRWRAGSGSLRCRLPRNGCGIGCGRRSRRRETEVGSQPSCQKLWGGPLDRCRRPRRPSLTVKRLILKAGSGSRGTRADQGVRPAIYAESHWAILARSHTSKDRLSRGDYAGVTLAAVIEQRLVTSHQACAKVASGSYQDAVRGIRVYVSGQTRAFDGDFRRQRNQREPGGLQGLAHPIEALHIQVEAVLRFQNRHLPNRNNGEQQHPVGRSLLEGRQTQRRELVIMAELAPYPAVRVQKDWACSINHPSPYRRSRFRRWKRRCRQGFPRSLSFVRRCRATLRPGEPSGPPVCRV